MDRVSIWLTHWGRVTHICVGNLTITGPDNGLPPGRRQAIIWTNAGILLIGRWGTNFSEILIGIHTLSFKKIHLKMSSAKWRPFCLGLNVLTIQVLKPEYSEITESIPWLMGCLFSLWKWQNKRVIVLHWERFHLYPPLKYYRFFPNNSACEVLSLWLYTCACHRVIFISTSL